MLLAFVTVTGVGFAGMARVAEFDEAAAVREQTVVANGIRGRVNEVAHLTDLEVVCDDAVRHLDNQFDMQWAQDNIGTFLWQNSLFEDSFILAADDRPMFSTERGKAAPMSLYASFVGSTA
jgi:sensor domain CHASE-containing protein